MNKLGDVIKGDQIGRKSKEWFIWAICPNCGLERWVRRSKTELTNYTGWCQVCNAKRNNKIRTYNKAEKALLGLVDTLETTAIFWCCFSPMISFTLWLIIKAMSVNIVL